MRFNGSSVLSEGLLASLGMQMYLYNENRIPTDTPVIVISNHRSFMDALILIKAVKHPIRIACHRYMGQIPLMREVVHSLGCFPLESKDIRQQDFLERGTQYLKNNEWVGLFPEGGTPMVRLTPKEKVGAFQKGFAHLAFRANVPNLAVLPVAIAPFSESVDISFPIKLLKWFDPEESLFNLPGNHPVVIYHRANIIIGRPYWITASDQQNYQGKGAKKVVRDLSNYCHDEISNMLRQQYS